jgi:hypothetical protein
MVFKRDALQASWPLRQMVFKTDGLLNKCIPGWMLLELDGLRAADPSETLENRQCGDPATREPLRNQSSLGRGSGFPELALVDR